jgi:hypothetical protein
MFIVDKKFVYHGQKQFLRCTDTCTNVFSSTFSIILLFYSSIALLHSLIFIEVFFFFVNFHSLFVLKLFDD